MQKKKIKVLNLEDRKLIQELLHKRLKHKDICEKLDIHQTTLYREVKRCKDSYDAEEAQRSSFKSRQCIDFEIIGKKFGKLTVESFANIYKHRSWWNCLCDCGKKCVINRKWLMEYCSPKRPLSCGCIPKQAKGRGGAVPFEESSMRKYEDLLKFRKISGTCWEWQGYKQNGKCPMTSWRNKTMSVRKCMYLIFNGTTYEPNPVHTTCGNLSCFNPDHITIEPPLKRHLYEE
jgi:hypothetical protein